jgi:DNA-binding IclR family transcriptional regulator
MEVKLVARTLELFEVYSREGTPLSLTELARCLGVPMSSTLALVRTLTKKGYLYETRKRGGYYPTRRMLGLCQQIDTTDPLLNLLHPHLVALRDSTSETVVLGKRQELSTIYLDAVESFQAIRYTASAGQQRPLYANSIGKALLSVMPDDEVQRLAERFDFKRFTSSTIISAAALRAELKATRTRHWASNVSETFADLAAIAMPFRLNDEWYGVSVVGPLLRMQESWDKHVVALRQCVGEMELAITTDVQ